MSNNQVAVIERNIVDGVVNRVREFQKNGELIFPDNYIPENALKSAYLMLQETVDRNKKPVLDVCTKPSIANALLSMVVQGLNPDKKQCYFIAYGNKLQLQRSYFGAMHVAKTVDTNIEDIYAAVVYDGDDFEYEIRHGKERVIKHTQKLGNININNIVAAYTTILYKDGKEVSTIMTIEQIKQAWKQSPMSPIDEKGNIKASSTHAKFTEEMAKKTVINRACKYAINGSSDTNIIAKFAKELDIEIAEAETQAIIEENANQEYLDFDEDTGEIIDVEDEIEEEPEVLEEEQIEMEGPGY
jgi:recombination protein RecT